MKRVTIPLWGREYPMCFSLRVVQACGERFGGLEGLDEALTGGGDTMRALDNSIWLLARLLEGGYRYDRAEGREAMEPPSTEDLLDRFGVDDLGELQQNMMAAMVAGSQRTVEAEPGKNGEAAQETAAS